MKGRTLARVISLINFLRLGLFGSDFAKDAVPHGFSSLDPELDHGS
jgi:hypothetical protein